MPNNVILQINRPIANYESLKDPHLQEYFKRPIVRRHLRRFGLVNKIFN